MSPLYKGTDYGNHDYFCSDSIKSIKFLKINIIKNEMS